MLFRSLHRALVIDGRHQTHLKDARAVAAFQNDPQREVIIGSPGASLTNNVLQIADRILVVEQDWTGAATESIEEQVHRLGGLHPTEITYLVGPDEEKIDSRLTKILQQTANDC